MIHIKNANAVPNIKTQGLMLELLSRHQETHNIVSFEMSVTTENGKPFRHYPGQAIAIALPLAQGEVFRTFTIASGIPKGGRIVLTVKAAEHADATAYMHQHLTIGDKIKGQGPFGHFSVVHHPKKPLLLIGAGSGLTPMLSCLRWLYHRNEANTDVICIQQASTPSDIICREELMTMSKNLPRFTYIDSVSRLVDKELWSGLNGRLTLEKLQTAVPDIAERTVLCCGPQEFTNSIHTIYQDLGGDENNFLTESFAQNKSTIEDDLGSPSENNDKEYAIELDGKRFTAKSNESILNAAARSGIIIPSACRAGACGTCKLKVLEGETTMNQNDGMSKKEETLGYILSCSTVAKTDLMLTKA